MPSVVPISATSPRKLLERAAASFITATTRAFTPRTRASGAMREGASTTAALDSVAMAFGVQPRNAANAAACAPRRVVFDIAFPPAGGQVTARTPECGNGGVQGQHREKQARKRPELLVGRA